MSSTRYYSTHGVSRDISVGGWKQKGCFAIVGSDVDRWTPRKSTGYEYNFLDRVSGENLDSASGVEQKPLSRVLNVATELYASKFAEDITLFVSHRDELDKLRERIQVAFRPIQSLAQNRLNLAEARQKTQELLAFKDDWDDCGASPFSESTVRRVFNVLEMLTWVADSREQLLPKPLVNPADEASIDIYWIADDKTLLMNVSAVESALISFYGSGVECGSIAGEFPAESERPDIVAWLAI